MTLSTLIKNKEERRSETTLKEWRSAQKLTRKEELKNKEERRS